MTNNESWDIEIHPQTKWYNLQLMQLWRYRDLLLLFVRRDFVAFYKQTILGPLWFLVQPIITTITFSIIFGNLAGISTEGVPKVLFYMSTLVLWTYFADTLTKTADTFSANAHLFGKVYFPRMIVPLSVVVSNLIKLGIQLGLFVAFYIYYLAKGATFVPTTALWLVPYLIVLIAILGLGLGIIISSLTTKYRDLKFLVTFGVQLLMYASPIVYPLSTVPAEYRVYVLANPITAIIETFKYAFLGIGEFNAMHLAYSTAVTFIILIIGLIIFHRVEKSFMDTV
ncbi:MAG: ABC transporter permease [Bacteroidia bacterium]